MKHLLPILAACWLAACGQTGALYLPDAGIDTGVEIRPAAPAQEGDATPASDDTPGDGEQDKPAPPGAGTGAVGR